MAFMSFTYVLPEDICTLLSLHLEALKDLLAYTEINKIGPHSFQQLNR